MADNEKLDNQRLKNFKNKGRDLEVKVIQIGVEDLFLFSAPLCSRTASPSGFLVTSFLISTIGNFFTLILGQRQYNQLYVAGLSCANSICFRWFRFTVRARWL